MSAVVPLSRHAKSPDNPAEPKVVPAEASIESQNPAPVEPQAVSLDEAVIARAIAEAARTGRSTVDILKETAGLAPAELARVLAAALDYRFVDGEELSMLEPAFEVLPP